MAEDGEAGREVRERLEARVAELEGEVAYLTRIRLEERRGRTRAEAALGDLLWTAEGRQRGGEKDARDRPGDRDGDGEEDVPGLGGPFMRPVAVAETCFHGRRGTPRQSLLVPSALCRVRFRRSVHASEALEGITEFSHVWVIFVFHLNTNFHRAHWEGEVQRGFTLVRSKVAVPRLDGGKMGLFATRTPHRPCPVGLSVAKVERVEDDGALVLSGLDLVDGTPILDVKPYVPFCDCLPGATAPWWVDGSDAAEPIQGGVPQAGPRATEAPTPVEVEAGCVDRLEALWRRRGGPKLVRGLYDAPEDVLRLVREILGRDIRSLHQRGLTPADGRATKANAVRQSSIPAKDPAAAQPKARPPARTKFQLTLGKLMFMYKVEEAPLAEVAAVGDAEGGGSGRTVLVYTVDHLDDVPDELEALSVR